MGLELGVLMDFGLPFSNMVLWGLRCQGVFVHVFSLLLGKDEARIAG